MFWKLSKMAGVRNVAKCSCRVPIWKYCISGMLGPGSRDVNTTCFASESQYLFGYPATNTNMLSFWPRSSTAISTVWGVWPTLDCLSRKMGIPCPIGLTMKVSS